MNQAIALKPPAADCFTAALAVGLGVLWLPGTSRGEGGRIRVPLMPSLLLAAVARPAPGQEAGPTRAEALGLPLAATWLALRLFWEP